MFLLKSREEVEEAARRLSEVLGARGEWFVFEGAGGAALKRGEWEVHAAAGGLLFSYWGRAGASVWRVAGWEVCGAKLVLEATRRAGAERARL